MFAAGVKLYQFRRASSMDNGWLMSGKIVPVQVIEREGAEGNPLCRCYTRNSESPWLAVKIRFAVFEVDLEAGELRKQGVKLKLREQPFQVLALLLERPGQVVTREVVRDRLWPSGTFVDFEHGLNKAINRLREALGDDAARPRFIETLPRRGYRFLAAIENSPPSATAEASIRQPSIAVLPFSNLSGDRENEYFGDGLAEEIIGALGRIPGLKVTARTSAFAFRGKEQDIRGIARTLGVSNIFEGTVRREGGRVRITAQLVNAEDGCHLWSERYDRKLTDVFAIQDEIAQAITSALEVKLGAGPTLIGSHTPNLPAWEEFLKGRYYAAKVSPQSLIRARQCFEQAIALHPDFAMAWNHLGRVFMLLTGYGVLDAREGIPLARSAAQTALEIDPSLREAHALLGNLAAAYDYDWEEARRRFGLAMAREPVPPDVRCNYGFWYLLPLGRAQEAVKEYRRALEEDPLRLLSRVELAFCLEAANLEAEASAELSQVLELDENFAPALAWLSMGHAARGRFVEALALADRAHAAGPMAPHVIGLLGGLLVRLGDSSRAEVLLRQLMPGEKYGAPFGLMIFHVICSEVDKAAEWAEKAIQQRDFRVVITMSQPFLRDLRSSSHWPRLARRMNLPVAEGIGSAPF
jgi:TolB-like protein/Tfp pilus assembly protein PilF